jgi:signal transduction histidine kinase
VRISHKLTAAFCVAALFLLAVEIAAVLVVDRLNGILRDSSYYNQQLDQLGAVLRAAQENPTRAADQIARLNDLKKLARHENERAMIAQARDRVARGRPLAESIEPLQRLSAYYCTATAATNNQLLAIHRRAVIGIILIIIASILLTVVLMFLIRNWLLYPVRDLGESLGKLADGHLDHKIQSSAGAEFAQIAACLNTLTARLRELEQRVAHAEKFAALGEACAHVTHNVRSLLQSIRSLAQHESNVAHAGHGSRVGFNYIIATVNKLDAWVRDLHAAVRPLEARLAPQQIEPIIHDALSLLQPNLAERNLEVRYDAPDELPEVIMDRGLFEQAFVAVLTNAIEASPDNARIAIVLRNGAGDRVTVRIEDEGAGMTEATRAHAFEPFFSTKPDRPGLGLSVAQSIVKRHGGEIQIETATGHGTRVSIHMPAAKKRS